MFAYLLNAKSEQTLFKTILKNYQTRKDPNKQLPFNPLSYVSVCEIVQIFKPLI